MKKVLIAVPCMDMVSARFAQCLATLKKVDHCVVSFLINSLVYDSRNKLAEYAVKGEFDYIMWLDSDMVFPPNTLEHMMNVLDEHPEIDILSSLYFRRGAPFSPVAFDELSVNDRGECHFVDMKEIPTELREIAGCGFGCVLMHTDCLFDLAGKYGNNTWFTPMGNVGEDCSFCIRARNEDYKIYCDPTLKIGHMAYAPVDGSVYEATREDKK